MSISLIEQLPKIVKEGKREVEKIMEATKLVDYDHNNGGLLNI